jgi:glutamate-1-semialdehyde 2,1-aminomutase
MNSDQLFEKSLKYVPGGVHSPVRSFKGLHQSPRFINKAAGAYLFDEEKKKYIDFCMSFGPLILGHRNEKVERAVIEAITRGWTYGACEKYSLELAEFLIEKIPHIEQIRFVNSGTEAVMTAVRLARGYTKKTKIIKFDGCYHGHLDGMLIKAGSGLAGEGDSTSAGVTKQMAADTLICELDDIEAVREIFKHNKGDVAAVFIEPLPANNGIMIQNHEFHKELRSLCDENDALLVYDEVISGFRVGFEGMAKDLGIIPDMVTYGKIIGGGFPVGAVASSKEIMEKLAPVGDVYQAGTLSANPVAMAAGLANLKQLTDSFYTDLENKANSIVAIFNDWLSQSEFSDYNIIQYKSLFWLTPGEKGITKPSQIPKNLAERFYKLFENVSNKGIYLSPNAYEISFVSTAHDEKVQQDLKARLWS